MRIEDLREQLNGAGIELTPYLKDPTIPPRIAAEVGQWQHPLPEVEHPDKSDLAINVFDEVPEERLNEMAGRRRRMLKELGADVKIYGIDALALPTLTLSPSESSWFPVGLVCRHPLFPCWDWPRRHLVPLLFSSGY